jgi:hypothetical protein
MGTWPRSPCRGCSKFIGLEPGACGSYFQPFVMKGFSTYELDLAVNGTGLNYPEEVVGNFTVEKGEAEISGSFSQNMIPLEAGEEIVQKEKGMALLTKSDSGNWQFV